MNVSRRNWLAAAGASMLLPRSIQAADLHGSGDPDVWPVVVVGSGLAGLSAAYSAMQNAAGRVLLLEKGPLIGGHSQYSSGSIATVVPHDPKRSGWQDSVEQFIADALAVGGGSGDTAVLTALARDSYSAQVARIHRRLLRSGFYREVRSASAMLCDARQLRRPQLRACHGAMRERRRCHIPTEQSGGGL